MNELLRTVSSLFGRSLFGKRQTQEPVIAQPESKERQFPSKTDLQALNAEQLREFLGTLSEKAVIRLLQSLTDPAIQLSILHQISQESLLKRVIRSELDKKLKKTAERKLRELTTPVGTVQPEKLARLSDRIQNFLLSPRWTEAKELLELAFAPEWSSETMDPESKWYQEFENRRTRMRKMIEEFEDSCAELKRLCQQLELSRPLSRSELKRIQNRWEELEGKYDYPPTLTVFEDFACLMKARAESPRKSRQTPPEAKQTTATTTFPTAPAPVPAKDTQKRQASQERLQALENLLQEIQNFGRQFEEKKSQPLAARELGQQLRQLQNQTQNLKRWKHELSPRFEEAETLLLESQKQVTTWLQEKQWDNWARTDRALRIQADLEKLLGEIESTPDPENAWRLSVELTKALPEYFREMKELGRLEPGKDHQIWEQFKTLTDRGWSLCEKMRGSILEKLQAMLANHLAQQIEWNPQALASPRATLKFQDTAFAEELYARLQELHSLWRGIGRKPTEAHREAAALTGRIFELYFREANIHSTRTKRLEAALEKARATATSIQERTQTLLGQLQAKSVPSPAQALKSLSGLEEEINTLERELLSLQTPNTLPQPLRDQLALCKNIANQEIAERVRQRDQLLAEAKKLALSADWESASGRFEELRAQWKNLGNLGQSDNALFNLIFENLVQVHQTRLRGKDQSLSPEQLAQAEARRKELLLSLEALSRFQKAELPPLPFGEAENASITGKLLELGMRYKQILALDPQAGAIKETKKIMEQWGQLPWPSSYSSIVEEELNSKLWECYLSRIQTLLY